eukprot:1977803-Amphidinium_carterae.2
MCSRFVNGSGSAISVFFDNRALCSPRDTRIVHVEVSRWMDFLFPSLFLLWVNVGLRQDLAKVTEVYIHAVDLHGTTWGRSMVH